MTRKILIDLKPALDGYAGIPQETRLLFANISRLKNIQTEGLIQHGSKHLQEGLKLNSYNLTPAKKINKLGKVIISIVSSQEVSFIKLFSKIINFNFLKLKAILHIKLLRSIFEAENFQDFIWHNLFSKSLDSSYKSTVVNLNYSVLQPSRHMMNLIGLGIRRLGIKPIYLKLNTNGIRFFLAQTPFPGRVSKGTILLIRYHDAVPLLMPHTISDGKNHQASHFYALQDNIEFGAWFICVSESTRQDLIKLYPQVASRSIVIHNIVSEDFFCSELNYKSVLNIIYNRINFFDKLIDKSYLINNINKLIINNKEIEYLLAVSTIEPRKNYLLLLEAFEYLKTKGYPDLKLIIVGSLGWGYKNILQAFIPLANHGDLFYLSNIPSYELRVLYQHAKATVCPSLGEGFGYPGIEAMRCGSVVIASDIPVHREIYSDAAIYFNPYNVQHTANIISKTIANNIEAERIRLDLCKNAEKVSKKYLKENILHQWQAFFDDFPNQI